MKIIKILSSLSIVALICIGAYIYTIQKSSIPPMSGVIQSGELNDKVEIIRDKEGIPHIYASSDEDLFYALGFTHASERIFQFDLLRRAGSGRLSEVLGEATLKFDKLFRTLGANKVFKDNIEQMDPEIKSRLQKYMDGINFYLKTRPLPIEFKVLGYTPEKFTLMDSYYLMTYMAYSFTPMLREDVLFEKVRRVINKKKLNRDISLLKVNRGKSPKVSSNFSNIVLKNIYGIDSIIDFLSPIEGSNAWSVSGELTKSGKPILASDPHITFSVPNIWYEVHLVNTKTKYEMYSHLLPLIPFPVMGHNDNLGWGLTMSYVDDLDVFYEDIEDGHYLRDGIKKKIEIVRETIKVKGKPDTKMNIIWTDRGPLVGHLFGMKNISMKWAYLEPSNKPIKTFFDIGRATNLEEFKKSLHHGKSPGINIVYADKDGNIGQFLFGAFYKRDSLVDNDGINKPELKTEGMYEFIKAPHRQNPKDGLLVSTNDEPTHATIDVRGSWYPKNRHDTAFNLLSREKNWTIDKMKKVQVSNNDHFALKYRDEIVKNLNKKPTFTTLEKKAFDALKKWDGLSVKNSVGALIYHHFNYHFLPEVLDELDEEQVMQYCKSTSSWSFHKRLMEGEDNLWWDKASTKNIETKQEILISIFNKTIKDLENKLGADFKKWNWGALHTIEFPHPFGRNKLMAKVFNLGPYPVDGAINVINHMRRKGCSDSHKVKSGPSTRRLIDFANPRVSFGILPLGNSGHMMSPFFQNQRERFLKGEYRLQLMNKEDIKLNHYSTLNLTPLSK